MRLSTSTNIYAFAPGGVHNGIPACVEACARAGYEMLDVNLCEAMNPDSPLRGDGWQEYVERIARQGRDAGLAFHQTHLPYYDVFACRDEGKRALMEELIRRSIIATGILGARWAVTHPCTVYEAGSDMALSQARNLDYFAPHVSLARQQGVGLALENDFEYRTAPWQRIFCAEIGELCALADAFSAPEWVGVCYDFGHAHMTGGFHRQNLNRIGKRLKATHVADNHGQRDEHLMPFYGTIDWAGAMAGLRDIGYAGELTYEIQEFGRGLPNDLKYLVIDQSLVIGRRLIELYENAEEETR